MSRKVLKAVSLILMMVLLTVTALTGCGKTAEQKAANTTGTTAPAGTTQPQEKPLDPIEVNAFLMSDAGTPDDFIVTKIIKDKFNITINWNLNPYDGYFDKLNVMVGSNELPDIIAPVPIDNAKDLGVKGALVAFNKYLDKMPNLNKILQNYKIDYTSSIATDGNVYAAPALDPRPAFRYAPVIRKDLLDETGLPAPQTFDELHDVLKAIKAKHPDNLGIVNYEKADILNDFGTNFNTRMEIMYDDVQDKFVYCPKYDGYKELITWFNRMWNDKLVDPELFTASQKQWQEKVTNGLAGFFLNWPDFAATYEKDNHDLNKDSKVDYATIQPMTSKYYGKKVVQGMPVVNTWCSIALSSKSKYIDRLISLIDWMYSDEGSNAMMYGVEGQTYTVDGDKKKFNAEFKRPYNDKGTKDAWQMNIGPDNNLWIRYIRTDELLYVNDYMKDYETVTKPEYVKNNYYLLYNKGMSLSFTEAQQDELKKYQTDIKTYVEEMSIKFITGKVPMSDYENFRAELDKRGAPQIEAIYAEAYAKFKDTMSKLQ